MPQGTLYCEQTLHKHLETVCESFHDTFDKGDLSNPYILSWRCSVAPHKAQVYPHTAQQRQTGDPCVRTLFCQHTPSFQTISNCLASKRAQITFTDHETSAMYYFYTCMQQHLLRGGTKHSIASVCVDLMREKKCNETCCLSQSDNARCLATSREQQSERKKNRDCFIVHFELRPFDFNCEQ